MSDDYAVASRETPDDAQNGREFVGQWLEAIAISSKEESNWRKRAESASSLYRTGAENSAGAETRHSRDADAAFNILYANVETEGPALYNSAPIPDVRRRYADDDATGKEVSDILERCLSYSIDDYDFDANIKHDVKDMQLTGRGLSRVRYQPYFSDDGTIADEQVVCEHVQWKQFRRGPGRTWDDVPWIAFELFLSRDQLVKLNEKIAYKIPLDCSIDEIKEKGQASTVPEIFKRARVWEIWDKDAREQLFIAEGYLDGPIVREPDPLGLKDFWPVPRPLYSNSTSDSLVPMVPYDFYKDQARELERVSQRIIALVSAMKARGIYDGRMAEIGRLVDADDNELVAVENALNFADGGLDKAIAWWPIETIAGVLERLYVQRDQIKQTIYEITGLSDILRGQSDPNETLGAQELKAQNGSLRVQSRQAEIQRYVRDLFRIKSEIICSKFQWQTIINCTGLSYPTEQEKASAMQQAQQMSAQQQPVPEELKKVIQKPSQEQVEGLIRNDAMRGYRVDIESDSTIRSDMTRRTSQMNLFLQGTAQYAQAMGPIVQLYPPLVQPALEVYSAFARTFKLGKQAEDALDHLSDDARKMMDQPEKPDPALEAEKMKAEGEKQKMQMQMEMLQRKHSMEIEKMQMEMQREQQKLELDQQRMALEAQKMNMEMQMARQQMAMKAESLEHSTALNHDMTTQKHGMALEMMEHKAEKGKKEEMEDDD